MAESPEGATFNPVIKQFRRPYGALMHQGFQFHGLKPVAIRLYPSGVRWFMFT